MSITQLSDISSLWCWLKSDTGVFKDAGVTPAAAGDSVQQWNDQSGNGRNFSQATAGKRPILTASVQNSLPGIRFDATDDAMGGPSGLTAPYSVVIVYDYRSATSANRRAIQGSNNWMIGPSANTHRVILGGVTLISSTYHFAQNQFVVAILTSDSFRSRFYLDDSPPLVTDNVTGAPGTLNLGGAGFAPTEILNGDILEVGIYSKVLSVSEIEDIQDYLGRTKYALWSGTVNLRATQVMTDVLVTGSPTINLRVTEVAADALVTPTPTATPRITQVMADVLVTPTDQDLRLTEYPVEFLYTPGVSVSTPPFTSFLG